MYDFVGTHGDETALRFRHTIRWPTARTELLLELSSSGRLHVIYPVRILWCFKRAHVIVVGARRARSAYRRRTQSLAVRRTFARHPLAVTPKDSAVLRHLLCFSYSFCHKQQNHYE